ncbi:ATP-binding protein [Methanococcoides methylutens]|uniref:Bipolar DNA helicase n=1 Tax=Methanococcoides methylutens MM1 TaxID=1434104 RepID=A0A0E3X1G5_METMT|nr:ATP-binding protein [Methanococcoides methylutens]AKB86179.1 Bipolar DNA helicase [Methanococcoides methylutens MM1]
MINLKDDIQAGVVKKRYILGRRNENEDGVLDIGRYLALDRSSGSHVAIDALKPHAILICGKRGYGKSYTMATLIEEISLLPDNIRQNLSSLVIDTMGIFWTLDRGNDPQKELLQEWNMEPAGFDAEVFVPAGHVDEYRERHIEVTPFSIPVAQLHGYDWCELFSIKTTSPLGVLLVRIIEEMRESNESFSFEDISSRINADDRSDDVTKMAAENYLRTAASWSVFEKDACGISELIRKGRTSVLDVSSIEDKVVRSAVVGIIARDTYNRRLKERRSYERMAMGDEDIEQKMPMVWMFIDEAHLFVPSQGETLASDVLINEWVRQGRQPGLSIIFATQRPAALHPDIISQSDIVICHRLTARDDIEALEAIRPTYMKENIGDAIRKMGLERGIAFVVDDTSESTHLVKVRPRYSWHGGNEPSALNERR